MGRLGKAMKDMERARAEDRASRKGAVDPNKKCMWCTKDISAMSKAHQAKHMEQCQKNY